MKRICFLTDSIFSFGGVQRVTAVIAKQLAKEYDVTIVTMDPPSAKDTSLYALEEADLHYRFFSYPATPAWKNALCKCYSALYRKVFDSREVELTPYTYAIHHYQNSWFSPKAKAYYRFRTFLTKIFGYSFVRKAVQTLMTLKFK